jgi:hypothetical protein
VDDGGYTYVYGSEPTDDFNFVHLARVPAGGLLGAWQFWDGAGWSPDEAKSARLASGVGTSFSVDRVQGRFVLVSMESHLRFNPRSWLTRRTHLPDRSPIPSSCSAPRRSPTSGR